VRRDDSLAGGFALTARGAPAETVLDYGHAGASRPRSTSGTERLVTTLRLGLRQDDWRAETENDHRSSPRIQPAWLLGYLDRADVTGSLDYPTEQALLSLQGWEDLDRTGSITGQTQVALFGASRPEPAARRPGKRIEIYRDRGVLLMIDTGEVVRAVHTSTGAGA
jgi:hypothetical protein